VIHYSRQRTTKQTRKYNKNNKMNVRLTYRQIYHFEKNNRNISILKYIKTKQEIDNKTKNLKISKNFLSRRDDVDRAVDFFFR
jgi:hypothetical protein